MNQQVLIDTSPLVAILSKNDDYHQKVVNLPEESTTWLKNYLLKYHDIGAQIADISLCYLAEILNIDTIFTLDKKDFNIYRINNNQALKMIP